MSQRTRLSTGLLIISFIFVLSAADDVPAGDLNGDGTADLVVGIYHEDVGAEENAGSVNTIFGSPNGLTTAGAEFVNQDLGLIDTAEAWDSFGRDLALGDFNGDGLADRAIGVHWEDFSGLLRPGAVHVLYSGIGSPALPEQFWTQANATGASIPEEWDIFGCALASGDFNGDGYDDLAVGSAGEDVNTTEGAGAVVVLFGTESGLVGTGSQWWISSFLDGELQEGATFGDRLVAGDFDADGFDDLAISAPHYQLGEVDNAGAVFIAYGGTAGLENRSSADLWYQGRYGIEDEPETYDRFGRSLASADFNCDGFDDLAIGVPEEDIGAIGNAGAFHVLYGSQVGITSAGAGFFHQDNFDAHSDAETSDKLGFAMAAGYITGDGCAELVVAAAHETIDTAEYAGMVHLLWGRPGGLTGMPAAWFTEDDLSPGSPVETGEHFGAAVAVGDFDGDGFDDLAIGAPGEDLVDGASVVEDAGTIFVMRGVKNGISLGAATFDQCTGIPGDCEAEDDFGGSLAARPREIRLFVDRFETGDTSRWSAVVH